VYVERKTVNGKKYISKIKINKQIINLGYYYTPQEAAIAYNNAIDKCGYTGRPKNIINDN
jgi:hypothetical protein